jgi:hypothetical protein
VVALVLAKRCKIAVSSLQAILDKQVGCRGEMAVNPKACALAIGSNRNAPNMTTFWREGGDVGKVKVSEVGAG